MLLLLMEEILHQLRLVVNPIIYKVYVSQVVQDFWTINSSWWFQSISKKNTGKLRCG